MSLGTLFDSLQTPFFSRLQILAEHPFARTRGIDYDAVKQMFATLSVFGRRVVRNDSVAVSPFLDVLAKDEHALPYHFVAQQQTVTTEKLADECRFASRRGA